MHARILHPTEDVARSFRTVQPPARDAAWPRPRRTTTTLAWATMCSILFFLKRNSMPLFSLLATSRLRPITFDQSKSVVSLT